MSVDYAAGLSHYDDLGDCGLDEVFDGPDEVKVKVKTLAGWLRHHNGSCVFHVGAGISTAAGIRDFRGKGGVWTELLQNSRQSKPESSRDKVACTSANEPRVPKIKLEDTDSKNLSENSVEQPDSSRCRVRPFDETEPTYTHMALKELCSSGLVKHIISQNVDGLFLKSGLPRRFISELHGDFYLDECTKCRQRFIRGTASPTMRLTKSSVKCPRGLEACKGHLRDTILDWESPVPYNELRVATREANKSLLHICIGTSMQLRPSKDLVCDPTKQRDSKLVVINLQPTGLDQKASLVINYYADSVMKELVNSLDLEVPLYDRALDPTKDDELVGTMWRK